MMLGRSMMQGRVPAQDAPIADEIGD